MQKIKYIWLLSVSFCAAFLSYKIIAQRHITTPTIIGRCVQRLYSPKFTASIKNLQLTLRALQIFSTDIKFRNTVRIAPLTSDAQIKTCRTQVDIKMYLKYRNKLNHQYPVLCCQIINVFYNLKYLHFTFTLRLNQYTITLIHI